jgi:hypothetical protein
MLDGIIVKVSSIEVNIEFIEEVIILMQVLDYILDGLFGGDMLAMVAIGHVGVLDINF